MKRDPAPRPSWGHPDYLGAQLVFFGCVICFCIGGMVGGWGLAIGLLLGMVGCCVELWGSTQRRNAALRGATRPDAPTENVVVGPWPNS